MNDYKIRKGIKSSPFHFRNKEQNTGIIKGSSHKTFENNKKEKSKSHFIKSRQNIKQIEVKQKEGNMVNKFKELTKKAKHKVNKFKIKTKNEGNKEEAFLTGIDVEVIEKLTENGLTFDKENIEEINKMGIEEAERNINQYLMERTDDNLEDVKKMLKNVRSGLNKYKNHLNDTTMCFIRVGEELNSKGFNLNMKQLEDNKKRFLMRN